MTQTDHDPFEPLSLFEEIFPGDTNAYGTAFGGRILALMDRAAGLVASRYAKCHFVTASLDSLKFQQPVKQGEIAEIEARVVYVSRHTCGVDVRVYAVDKTSWTRRQCCVGIFFMVAVGEGDILLEIPQFVPETQEQKVAWERAESIHRDLMRG
jgi:acyl-CoA hydrolase